MYLNNINITNIYTYIIPPLKISFPLKTFTLSLIPGMPGVFSTTAASASIEYIRVYLAIAISIRVNIVYKQVIKIVKNI